MEDKHQTKLDNEEWEAEIDDLPAAQTVRPLPRKWALSPQEQDSVQEGFLIMLARDLQPFRGFGEVEGELQAYFKYGGWRRHGEKGEAALCVEAPCGERVVARAHDPSDS